VDLPAGTYAVSLIGCDDVWLVTIYAGGLIKPTKAWQQLRRTWKKSRRSPDEVPPVEWTRLEVPSGMANVGGA
jgi:hypothetical protein